MVGKPKSNPPNMEAYAELKTCLKETEETLHAIRQYIVSRSRNGWKKPGNQGSGSTSAPLISGTLPIFVKY